MRFIERAIERAGLSRVLSARRAGRHDELRATMDEWKDADLLALGAVADLVRAEEIGDEVVIHAGHKGGEGRGVLWIEIAASDLDVLRAVAIARIASARGARIGVEWSRHGIELAQVALGFGASDWRGAVQRKSGLPILEDESKKVKGRGNVSLASIRKAEIAALVKHAGRLPVFADDEMPVQPEAQQAHV